MKPVSRTLTFLCGVAFTLLMFGIVKLVLSIWLEFNWMMNLGLFGLSFILFFVTGIVKIAGKGNGKDADIEAGFVGVVKAFNAPLPESLRFLLPTGNSWLPPLITEAAPVDIREQAFSIPPEEGDDGFDIESLSEVKAGDRVVGTKYVGMISKVRIRYRVPDPYLWYLQDQAVIERTLVTSVVESMRFIAANGSLPPGHPLHGRFVVSSDLDLMRKRHELGDILTQDIRNIVQSNWGIEVIDVIVRVLRPRDPELMKRYQQVAQEIADREAQSIETQHIIDMAKKIQIEQGIPWGEALTFAMLVAGKTTLENLKIVGGGQAVIFKGDGPQPPSPSI